MDIKLFNSSDKQIRFSGDARYRFVDGYMLVAELVLLTKKTVIENSEIGKTARWVFCEKQEMIFGFGDLLARLRILEVSVDIRKLETAVMCGLDQKLCDKIIRLAINSGFWLRKLKKTDQGLTLEKCENFDPQKDGFVWIDSVAVREYYNNKNRTIEKKANELVREINRVESDICAHYEIYAAQAIKIDDSSYKLKYRFRTIRTGIGEDEDIVAIINNITIEDIRKI